MCKYADVRILLMYKYADMPGGEYAIICTFVISTFAHH